MVCVCHLSNSFIGTNQLTFLSRDSEASAPAEFPPEQPEADLVANDEEEYGADEAQLEEELVEGAAETTGEPSAAGEDADMDGIAESAEAVVVEEDEMSEDGSVDLENESDDELEEDEEAEVEAAGGDEMDMDVDMDKPSHPSEIMAH